MPHRSQLAQRAGEGFLREQVARLGAEFAPDHVFVEAVVAVDAHVRQVGLRSFDHAHLQVDGVSVDVHFGRGDAGEHVAVVVVEVSGRVLVLLKPLPHQFLVVDVAFLHAQDGRQIVGGVDGVAHPGHVSQIILASLVHLYVYVDVLGVVVPHAVRQDGGVAVAQFVVLGDEVFLVRLPAFGGEFLRFEE